MENQGKQSQHWNPSKEISCHSPPPPPIKKNFAFYVRYLLKFKLKMARLYMAKFFGDVVKGLICI